MLLVSLELEEIRSLSDRVLVIYEGEIVAELPPHSTEEDFGVAMTGGKVCGHVSTTPDEDLPPDATVAARLSTYVRARRRRSRR